MDDSARQVSGRSRPHWRVWLAASADHHLTTVDVQNQPTLSRPLFVDAIRSTVPKASLHSYRSPAHRRDSCIVSSAHCCVPLVLTIQQSTCRKDILRDGQHIALLPAGIPSPALTDALPDYQAGPHPSWPYASSGLRYPGPSTIICGGQWSGPWKRGFRHESVNG